MELVQPRNDQKTDRSKNAHPKIMRRKSNLSRRELNPGLERCYEGLAL